MRILFALLFCLNLRADWVETLKRTPCPVTSIHVYQTEPVELILKNFRAEGDFRGVVLCPSASDELYFFDWGTVKIEAANPTLFDALAAITNRTKLQLTFKAPFLLIHAQRDKLDEPISIEPKAEETKLLETKLKGQTYYLDRPWDRIHSRLKKLAKRKIMPSDRDPVSWHYYRISMVGEDLSVMEFIRALAYGAKTTVRIEKRVITFKSFS